MKYLLCFFVIIFLICAGVSAFCGDGVVETGEDCDDGFQNEVVDCSFDCKNILFQEDFEIGDFVNFSSVSDLGDSSATISNFSRSGKYSFRAFVPQAAGGKASLGAAIPVVPISYTRFYFYLDENFALSNGGLVNIATFVTTLEEYQRLQITKKSDGNFVLSSFLGIGQTNLSKNQWHYVELMVESGNPGRMILWLDDKIESQTTGVVNKLNGFGIGIIMTSGNPCGGTIYFDDLRISSGRINDQPNFIKLRHANSFGRTALKIDTTIAGVVSSDKLLAEINGTLFFEKSNPSKREFILVNMKPLSIGDYNITVKLVNSSSSVKAAASTILRKYTNGIPVSGIDENNNILYNGEKVFPFTPFMQNPDVIKIWKDNNYINFYGWASGYAETYSKEQYKEFLDTVKNIGLVSIGPNLRVPGELTNIETVIPEYVSYLKDHKGVFMWTWVDEPEINGVDANRIKNWMNICHSIDSNHLFAQNLYGLEPQISKNRNYLYPNLIADLYSFDVYPVGGCEYWVAKNKSPCPWDFEYYAGRMDMWRKYSYDLVPWSSIVEAGNDVLTDGPGVSAEQLRMEVWLNIVHGTKGLGWWESWAQTIQYTAIKNVVAEVTNLKDAILGSEFTGSVTDHELNGGRIDSMAKEYNNSVYVFAVNLKDKVENVEFSLTGVPQNSIVQVIDEGRTITMNASTFQDSFNSYGVHKYKINLALTQCNNNGVCESGLGETILNCPNDCTVIKTICEQYPNERYSTAQLNIEISKWTSGQITLNEIIRKAKIWKYCGLS